MSKYSLWYTGHELLLPILKAEHVFREHFLKITKELESLKKQATSFAV